jgi:FAD/FMN-containing dehydrogenase
MDLTFQLRGDTNYSCASELAAKHHIELPTRMNVLTGTVYAYPTLKLDVVSEKQKLFRLLNDYAALVDRSNGAFVSDGAEGRLKSNAAWSVFADNEAQLYEQLRAIFDPFGTLNPGVKQKNDIRSLVSALRSSYDATDFVA